MLSREQRKDRLSISGFFIKRHLKIYLTVALLISFFEVVMIIRGFFVFDFKKVHHLLYFISYFFLLFASLTAAFFLFRNRKKDRNRFYGIVVLVYCFCIVGWSTLISSLDMYSNNIPIVFLTILATIGGILVLDPVYFLILSLLGMTCLELTNIIRYNGEAMVSTDYINIAVFMIMSLIVCYRHYKLCVKNVETENELRKASYTCPLTGLGNEAAYIMETARLGKLIEENKADFALIVMDVNGIKPTNDMYGHRYGCHLIVKTGTTLPTIFTSSSLFHIGGDEFIVVLQGEDLKNIEKIQQLLKEKLEYQDVSFDGQTLHLSVAYGIAYYEKGMFYRDVFQVADKAMYENKKIIKEKYHIPER